MISYIFVTGVRLRVERVLAEEEFEVVVVRLDERAPPQVRTPVLDRLHQGDQLRSYAVRPACRGAMERLKKTIASSPWCSTAPMPGPEASQSTMNDRSKSCSWNIGAMERTHLRSWNAISASSVHEKPSLGSRRVSGAAMAP